MSVKWACKSEEYFSFLSVPKLVRLGEDSGTPAFRLGAPLFQEVSRFLGNGWEPWKSFITAGIAGSEKILQDDF